MAGIFKDAQNKDLLRLPAFFRPGFFPQNRPAIHKKAAGEGDFVNLPYMNLPALDQQYWNNRYLDNDSGWDLGAPSTPLKTYIDQLQDKDLRILVPGAGNAYEAEYLWEKGFRNTFVIDLAPEAIAGFSSRVPGFPAEQLICGDFFGLSGSFDLILEQTFFCALNPALRQEYATKMARLLKPGGKLVGVLFNDKLNDDQPPFGGTPEEYEKYFRAGFRFDTWESCTNSIAPRAGREWFMILSKA